MGSLPKVDIQIEVKLNAGTLTREYGTYTNDVRLIHSLRMLLHVALTSKEWRERREFLVEK